VRSAAQAVGSAGGGANPRGRRWQSAPKDGAGCRIRSRRKGMTGIGRR
jgi:hypothetical protein